MVPRAESPILSKHLNLNSSFCAILNRCQRPCPPRAEFGAATSKNFQTISSNSTLSASALRGYLNLRP